ncbi:hypothetical protein DB345_09405 [Spartobacteria bacterium LR76]|nr:hypothetical protein DB345_09405 [Spartobacteria bacterium LR76]
MDLSPSHRFYLTSTPHKPSLPSFPMDRNTLPLTKMLAIDKRLLRIAMASLVMASGAASAFAADGTWSPYTTSGTLNWNTSGNWVGSTLPTSGSTTVVNFTPSVGVSQTFTSNNDVPGTFELNKLNLSGSSSSTSTARTITITGNPLILSGLSAAINNTTTTNGASGFVHYAIASNIQLDSNLSVSLGGTGLTTLASAAGSTIGANSAGLKTITFTGAGNANLGGNATAVVGDGSGQVGVVMAGSGLLTMGGVNTFSGGILIKSGTVARSTGSAGTVTSFGTGTIVIGDTVGTANAKLLISNAGTYANNITVQAGSSGVKTIENAGGSASVSLAGLITVNGDLALSYTGAGAGGFTIGAGGITGSGNITTDHNGTGNISLGGNNSGFTGGLIVNSGTTRVTSTTALSSSNAVAVNAGATFNINNYNQTVAGLNNGTGGGGIVTNAAAGATMLTLGGSGTYSFSGEITATTPANMALTVNLTGNGVQVLTGASTYTGATTVNAGTLVVGVSGNGSLTSAITVNAGVLKGSGSTTGNVTIGNGSGIAGDAVIAPGNSAGTFTTTGSLSLLSDAKFAFELNGATATADKLVANGVAINTSALFEFTLLAGTSGLSVGQAFTIIDNTGVGNISGTFNNLTAGGVFDSGGGLTFSVSGAGGTYGNDLVLTVATVPEPAVSLLAGCGLALMLFRRRQH